MGNATIVSLEAFKRAHERSGIRQQFHEHFEHWLDRVEEHMNGKPPTLEQMTEAVFTLRQELTGRVSEALMGEAMVKPWCSKRCPVPTVAGGCLLKGLTPARWKLGWDRYG
jgi:hypothetical protein